MKDKPMNFSLNINVPTRTVISLAIIALATIQVFMLFFASISLLQCTAFLLAIVALDSTRRILDTHAAINTLDAGEFKSKLTESFEGARNERTEYSKWAALIFIASAIAIGLIVNDSARATVLTERIATVIISLLTLKYSLLNLRLGAIIKSIDTATAQ